MRYDPIKCRVAMARVSGCALTIAHDAQQERNYAINRAMKELYDAGCRRIIGAKRLPLTGDGESYIVRGFVI
jgi:hypothetical protein